MPTVRRVVWIHAGLSVSALPAPPRSPPSSDVGRPEPTPAASTADAPPRGVDDDSRRAAAALATALARAGHTVTLFGVSPDAVVTKHTVEREPEAGSVRYLSLDDYQQCLRDGDCECRARVDWLVVNRHVECVPTHAQRDRLTIRSVWLWCYDVVPVGDVKQLGRERPVDRYLCLSSWHGMELRRHLRTNAVLLQTSMGLECSRFAADPFSAAAGTVRKVPGRFVYVVSSSNRGGGLDTVLACWPAVRAARPYATLHVYGDPRGSHGVQTEGTDTGAAADGIVWHVLASSDALRDAWYACDVWFYPTTSEETYCMSALEAQAAGALCVYSNLGSLPETMGGQDRGVLLPAVAEMVDRGDGLRTLVRRLVDEYITPPLSSLLVSGAGEANTAAATAVPIRWTLPDRRARAREWALRQTWSAVADQWVRWDDSMWK